MPRMENAMRPTLLLFLAGVLTTGCLKDNPNYCDPTDPMCQNRPDAAITCTGPEDCSGTSPVCYMPSAGPSVCVQCTPADDSQCTGVCEADMTCGPCTLDSQCDSGVCLPNGDCAETNRVVYASPAGATTGECATPGTGCAIAYAVTKASGTRDVVKLAAGAHVPPADANGVVIDRNVTLAARGATVANPLGNAITMQAGKQLTVIGGSYRGGSGNGIVCETNGTLDLTEATLELSSGFGIRTSECTVTVTRSKISQNTGGGLVMTPGAAKVAIVRNNLFSYNGNTGNVGAMTLNTDVGSSVEFNTIVNNRGNGAARSGIVCQGAFAVPNNLIWRNIGAAAQVSPECDASGSYMVAGSGGSNEPMFTDPDMTYSLTANSPAEIVDAGGACTLGVDFAGKPRPAGSACDRGAYERQ